MNIYATLGKPKLEDVRYQTVCWKNGNLRYTTKVNISRIYRRLWNYCRILDGEAERVMQGLRFERYLGYGWNWLLFKSTFNERASQKRKENNRWKVIEAAFFVSVGRGKVDKPSVIWKSKKPRVFRQANATRKITRFLFFKRKSRMQVERTENISVKLNQKMIY